MNRKLLAFLLILTFVASITGVSLAEFDYSVFNDNEQYEFTVEMDVMDDTGSISFPDDFKPLDTGSSGGDVAGIIVDFRVLSDALVLLRFQFVVKDWPDIKEIIFLPDKTRYTIKALSNQDSTDTTMYELVTTVVTPDLMPMFDEIIEKQITSIKYRLNGDDDIDGEMVVNVEQLELLIDLYNKAGGMKQDFSSMETAFPVTVK